MPIYDFTCGNCGKTEPDYRTVAARNDPRPCNECGGETLRHHVYRPMVRPDYPGYVSPATGKWVEGRAAHKEDLKQSGCRIYEPGETQAFLKNKEQRQKDFERKIDETVEKAAADIQIGAM